MAMQVERVFASIVVVENDLDDLAMAEHERISVPTVYRRVCSRVAGCQGRIERWNFGLDVGDAIEEGAGRSIWIFMQL